MAQRRMVSLKVTDTDIFLDMPLSTQALYFHLITRADDDGFFANPKKIMRMISCTEDDLKILMSKEFVIPFKSGVCVIKHWKIHNLIRSDRYSETIYKVEKESLNEDHNKVYIPNVIPDVNQLDTQSRLELVKDSIDIEEEKPKVKDIKHKYGEYKHVLLTDKQYKTLSSKVDNRERWIKQLDEYLENHPTKRYANHSLTIQNWYRNDEDKKPVAISRYKSDEVLPESKLEEGNQLLENEGGLDAMMRGKLKTIRNEK